MIANAASIKGVVGENLRNVLDWLPTGRQLITVKTDCDLSAHMQSITDTLISKEEDKDALIAFFARYGFKTWLRELSGDATAGATPLATARPQPDAATGCQQSGGLFGDAAEAAPQNM
jgi:DNA polymerase-1